MKEVCLESRPERMNRVSPPDAHREDIPLGRGDNLMVRTQSRNVRKRTRPPIGELEISCMEKRGQRNRLEVFHERNYK